MWNFKKGLMFKDKEKLGKKSSLGIERIFNIDFSYHH